MVAHRPRWQNLKSDGGVPFLYIGETGVADQLFKTNMGDKTMKAFKLIILGFFVFSFALMPTGESIAAQDPFKLVILGNDEDGFFDEEGNQLNGMVYEVARGTPIEITLKFSGEMDPEVEEEHFINMKLLSKADGSPVNKKKSIVKKFEPVSALNRESTIKWTAGEFGEKSMKLFCKTDCDGMDYMDNIKIKIID